jgi:formylmethanofuran dehydrogenase subunit B
VGEDRGPSAAAATVSLSPEQEIPALSVLRAVVAGNPLGELPPPLRPVADLASRLTRARYVAVVHDAEPGREARRDPHRIEGLVALTQALNGPTRATLSSLRGGGNRSGLESALTWQTGYPMAVDFTDSGPRCTPARRGVDRLSGAGFEAVLVVGTAEALVARRPEVPTVAVGPRASEVWSGARVALDTGVAGIHEGGTAYRMDEVPLPLTPPLSGARGARDTLERLLARLRQQRGARA